MFGGLAQLVERLLCKQDVSGSSPLTSIQPGEDHHQEAATGCILTGEVTRTCSAEDSSLLSFPSDDLPSKVSDRQEWLKGSWTR